MDCVRVVDVSPFMPGHYASTLLGELGAEVIQVEPPGGLPARRLAGLFESTCRNRRSVVLDLKTAFGREAFHRLADTADVVIEGFRPGVAARLGIDAETLSARNRRLVYCSISGFGQAGPLRDRMGHDTNYVAMSGGLAVFEDPAGPRPFGLPVGDLTASLHAVVGILAALLERTTTGRGRVLDVAIADGPLSFAVPRMAELAVTGRLPRRGVARGVFATGDGRFLTTGIVEDHAWAALCRGLDRPDLAEDPRFRTFADRDARAAELEALLAEIFRTRTLAEWAARLDGSRCSWAPVRSLPEAFADPQVAARGLVRSLAVGGRTLPVMTLPVKGLDPAPAPAPPPRAGEHTAEVLAELGYTDAELDALAAETRRP
ncbi:MAG TPA: CaiB/BaiF CoA-transferase family protein [Candidatus Binatia bacterium]|nr:CaiB/BaiF CoA-transferase family protein [Candidatus Binatia bacterium]